MSEALTPKGDLSREEVTTRRFRVPLGYFGALRIHLEPVVELTPETATQVVDQATAAKVVVGGSQKNVRGPLPCQLTWIVATDRVQKRVAHPRNTVVVPNGARFAVRELVDGATRDLLVDAFGLGIIGNGQLGYEIKLDLLGATPATCAPDDSGIEVQLAADVWFSDVTARGDRSQMPANMRVGKAYEVHPELANAWKGLHAKLHLATFRDPTHEANGSGEELEWSVGEAAGTLQWRVGARALDEKTSVLTYPAVEPDEGKHVVGWVLTLSRPDPTDAKKTQSLVLPAQSVGEFPHPVLTELSLAFVPSKSAAPMGNVDGRDVVLRARIDGLDPSFSFAVEAELYGRFQALPSVPSTMTMPFHELATSLHFMRPDASIDFARRVDLPRASCIVSVADGQLECVLLTDDQVHQSGLAGLPDLQMFGTIRVPPALVGAKAAIPFQRVVSFAPGEGDAGFAPMRDGKLVIPYFGVSVCSNLLGLDGASHRLEGPQYDPAEVMPLAACIFTEARDNPDDATRLREMRHVGGVICNRRRHGGDERTTMLEVVLQPMQFSYFNDESSLKRALKALESGEMDRWIGQLEGVDRQRFDECLSVAVELSTQPSSNPFAGDREVQHYLSPSAMKNKWPSWAADAGNKKFVVPGISGDRFVWFRGIARATSALPSAP